MRRYFNLTPSGVLTLLLFLGAAALAGASAYEYRSEAADVAPPAGAEQEEVSGMLVQELRAMFAEVPPPTSQFSAVAENNLFSPERKAWAPPPKEKPVPEEKEPPQPAGPHHIRLYGTSFSAEGRRALLHFDRFSSRQKHRIVELGETVQDDGENPRGGQYTLQRVEKDMVMLEDQNGHEIMVGLYDHDRRDPAPKPDPAAPPFSAADAPSKDPEPSQEPQGEPIRRMEDMPRSIEEREQLAKEGRLRVIDTPFGPVYRPVE
jgi:hypothetical protein